MVYEGGRGKFLGVHTFGSSALRSGSSRSRETVSEIGPSPRLRGNADNRGRGSVRQGMRSTPSYTGLRPASLGASRAAAGASKKVDTVPELRLRRALHRAGLRYRKNVKTLPGNPDIVFSRVRVAVFCDGDFWHGREWERRSRRIATGTNAAYWVRKIERNMERDQERQRMLGAMGWKVLRFWETEILNRTDEIVQEIAEQVSARVGTARGYVSQ